MGEGQFGFIVGPMSHDQEKQCIVRNTIVMPSLLYNYSMWVNYLARSFN